VRNGAPVRERAFPGYCTTTLMVAVSWGAVPYVTVIVVFVAPVSAVHDSGDAPLFEH